MTLALPIMLTQSAREDRSGLGDNKDARTILLPVTDILFVAALPQGGSKIITRDGHNLMVDETVQAIYTLWEGALLE